MDKLIKWIKLAQRLQNPTRISTNLRSEILTFRPEFPTSGSIFKRRPRPGKKQLWIHPELPSRYWTESFCFHGVHRFSFEQLIFKRISSCASSLSLSCHFCSIWKCGILFQLLPQLTITNLRVFYSEAKRLQHRRSLLEVIKVWL